ncbi:MAG TPA: C39 family peptidase [Ktedonobacteraceae bacterium]|nr:C39 family peptidase [Ktedonobacteraceae bacterium]
MPFDPETAQSPQLYCFPTPIPYQAQYASPELIHDYIYAGFDGRDDPRWHEFGSEDPAEYDFWCRRSCGIACLKMAIEALAPPQQPLTMMELLRQGLELGGYRVHDEQGRLVDLGWYYKPLVELGQRYGLNSSVCRTLTLEELCQRIRWGELIIASVSPKIGGREEDIPRRGGHLVLVHGIEWEGETCKSLLLHNPSGRYEDLRAGAKIPYERFAAAFAGRGIRIIG